MSYLLYIINLETQLYNINCNGATGNQCCDPSSYAQKSAMELSLNWEVIETCAYSDQGDNALLEQYQNTKKLDPPLTSVPWITLDNNSTLANSLDCEDDVLACVCAVYEGNSPACM